ncbi:hypothetical protein CONLIGDRAFT_649737 [Coniochaeta ligniaria NRRL 30616]|uniref:Peptidase C14 caspase domain-containing protein n=1 Tax=Coniochaeta ligniaria NRRL 30616 TaxID=1408157 RepID=A0A1J7J3H4_9PEZI|nr:hypothetical protein CONLIGDRAFT_649737 [Coniochaeta ligniaria NRRL 30616]
MSSPPCNKWAILIGIEDYGHPGQAPRRTRKNERGELIKFEPLEGCVNDVLAVEEYLTKTIRVPPGNITKLLSPRQPHPRLSSKTQYQKATYKNIVNALKDAGRGVSSESKTGDNRPKKGDFVYIHFSGHGSVASTIFTDLGKRKAVDETLVPCDITLDGHYLRDLELAALLEDMVDQGLVVTAVLDCCHSGGAVRGEADNESKTGLTRGVGDLYVSDVDRDRCQEMARIEYWAKSKPSWIDNPGGFVVLTACLEGEKAKETTDYPRHGLLTARLLHCLRRSHVDIPSQALFEKIRSEVQNINCFQTPDLIGDNERFFFSKTIRRQTYALQVSNCEYADPKLPRSCRKLFLDGGTLHGVEEGSGYDILPVDFNLGRPPKAEEVLAMVVVTSVQDGHWEARIRNIKGQETRWKDLVTGCFAVLNSVPIAKKTQVRFQTSDGTASAKFRDYWAKNYGDQVWLKLADTEDLGAFFTVTVDRSGNFSIVEPNKMIDPYMERGLQALPAADMEHSVPGLISRLEHMARFKVTRALSNVGSQAGSIAACISCEVRCCDEGTKPKKIDGDFFPRAPYVLYEDGVWGVPERRIARVTLRNTSDRGLSLVVMCCSAELGVSKLYPEKYTHKIVDAASTLEWGIAPTVARELRATADAGGDIIEVYKVFVTESPMNTKDEGGREAPMAEAIGVA